MMGGDILYDGTVENAEPPVYPIKTQIIWFLIVGLAFAYYLYKTKRIKA